MLVAHLDHGTRGQQRHEVGSQVGGDVAARRRVARISTSRDGDRRLLAVHDALDVPIKFIGTGEKAGE